jgi:bacterioferritin-associated ferredoxin
MIVCICNNVSDRDIRKAVADGMTTMAELRQNLGVATCCGKCNACAVQVLRKCLADTQQAQQEAQPTGFQPNWMPA